MRNVSARRSRTDSGLAGILSRALATFTYPCERHCEGASEYNVFSRQDDTAESGGTADAPSGTMTTATMPSSFPTKGQPEMQADYPIFPTPTTTTADYYEDITLFPTIPQATEADSSSSTTDDNFDDDVMPTRSPVPATFPQTCIVDRAGNVQVSDTITNSSSLEQRQELLVVVAFDYQVQTTVNNSVDDMQPGGWLDSLEQGLVDLLAKALLQCKEEGTSTTTATIATAQRMANSVLQPAVRTTTSFEASGIMKAPADFVRPGLQGGACKH
jgi:hypothetical protein